MSQPRRLYTRTPFSVDTSARKPSHFTSNDEPEPGGSGRAREHRGGEHEVQATAPDKGRLLEQADQQVDSDRQQHRDGERCEEAAWRATVYAHAPALVASAAEKRVESPHRSALVPFPGRRKT